MKNTKDSGRIRFFFYPSKKYGFCGVCPEFGIVHYDSNLTVLKKDVFDMAQNYLEVIREKKLSDENLNKKISFLHYLQFYWFALLNSLKNTVVFNQPYDRLNTSFNPC